MILFFFNLNVFIFNSLLLLAWAASWGGDEDGSLGDIRNVGLS